MSWFFLKPRPELPAWGSKLLDAKEKETVALRASLKEMIETQDEWERAIEKIIGRAPGVFNRAIDRAKKVLEETE